MTSLLLALMLTTADSTNSNFCNGDCALVIEPKQEYTISDGIKYKRSGDSNYASDRCSKVVQTKGQEQAVYLYVYRERVDHVAIPLSDTSFIKVIGTNAVNFYRQKTGGYNAIINPQHCSTRYLMTFTEESLPLAKKVMIDIRFSLTK